MAVARMVWPFKTAAELAARTSAELRTAERWLADERGISTDLVAALLRSEEGYAFLEAIMGDARPKWWRKYVRVIRLADLRRAQEEQRKEIEALERQAGEV